ncbi:MAG: YtoQ family protein [Gammaproteobacteria bacterium]|nr:YtoQ family protein [Gammaproteobacteria bacterium]
MSWQVYLSGEIHSDWREQLIKGCEEKGLAIEFSSPVLDHSASDEVGEKILGVEVSNFWKDHKAAKINAIASKKAIEEADVVVVRFGEKYRQWNAAFDAGYAAAIGTPLISLHDEELVHPLKEINAVALASCRTPAQLIEIFAYLLKQA